jgi:thiamine-phosphate pyrophosphorylase
MAVASGVDYFCVGPVWLGGALSAQGHRLVTYAAGRSPLQPWFAMGGITPDNLDEVLDAGATRVVVDRAVTSAPDPAAVVADLVDRLRR